MKSMRFVIRKSLVRSAVMIILAVFLLTNLGFTWMFSQYVANMRTNEVNLVLSSVQDVYADGELDTGEMTVLRQTANQSGVHLLIYTSGNTSAVFDSTVGGNGNKRALLSKQKTVIDPLTLKYSKFTVVGRGNEEINCSIGQQKGWLLSSEDLAFLIGVNVVYLIIAVLAIPTIWYFSKWLSNRLSLPIIQIHQATERIHRGDYQAIAIDKNGTLELDDLADAIEKLAFQLDHQESLRKRLTTDIAHELRSPLAVLRSQLEGISDGVLEGTPERFHRLNGEVLRLTKLIDDLSELTQVENDLYVLKVESVDLSALILSILEDYQPIFESKGLQLDQEIEMKLMWSVDPARFRQLLINLLANALKYTEQGSVMVRLASCSDGLILEVEDTGIGIDEKDIPFIFQRFYRVDPSRSRETGGSGIGLAITKHLVTAHGGQIEADSQIGKGTKIRIKFTSPS